MSRLYFPGRSSSGAVPAAPGQVKAAGHGETGQPYAEPPRTHHSMLQAAAALPHASVHGMASTRAACHEPAVPPPFPTVTRAPNGVLLHPVLQWQWGRARRRAPAGRVPPNPGGPQERLQLCRLPALPADR